MSAKTVEKRGKRSWSLYLMLRKGISKTWITSDKALFHLSFTTGEMKIQHISLEKRRKDAALLEKARKPSGVMTVGVVFRTGSRTSNPVGLVTSSNWLLYNTPDQGLLSWKVSWDGISRWLGLNVMLHLVISYFSVCSVWFLDSEDMENLE
ncbi:hypothetical protein TNCV_4607561 [Trichonephila clavipes]|nr:hypothetical protein TNCV_4607561 [Trichonephila clavipes]